MSFAAGSLFGRYNTSAMSNPLSPQTVIRLAFLTARRWVDEASAEDIAQETWVKLQAQAEREGADWESARARGWVRRVASNAARSLLRKRRDAEDDPDGVVSSSPDPATRAEEAEQSELDRALVQRLLGQLESDARRLLALRVLEELSWGEIATVLDERPSTLRSRFTRLRQTLRALARREREGGQ